MNGELGPGAAQLPRDLTRITLAVVVVVVDQKEAFLALATGQHVGGSDHSERQRPASLWIERFERCQDLLWVERLQGNGLLDIGAIPPPAMTEQDEADLRGAVERREDLAEPLTGQ